jgi:hypothetical protein
MKVPPGQANPTEWKVFYQINMSKPSVHLNVGIRIGACFRDKIMRFHPWKSIIFDI